MINVRKGLGDGNYMEMYYGSKGINNYIEICVNEKDFLTEKNYYVIRMLEDNDIDEIIKPAISKLDNNLFLRYQVNSFFVLDKYLIKSKPDITFLEAILNTVCNCEKIAERYLLNVDDLVISPDYMLWDDKTKKIKMIYAPFYNKKIQVQLKSFVEYMMRVFDYRDAKGVMKVQHIYELITKEDFDIKELEEIVSDKLSDNKSVLREKRTINEYIINDEEGCSENVRFENTYKKNDKMSHYSLSTYENTSNNKDVTKKENLMKTDNISVMKKDNRYEMIIGINAAITGVLFLLFLFLDKGKNIFILFLASIITLVINSLIYILKKDKEEEIDIDKSMQEFENIKKEYVDIYKKEYADEYKREYADEYIKEKHNEKSFNTKEKKELLNRNDIKKEYKLIPLNDGMLEPMVIKPDKKEIVIGRGRNEADYRLNKEQISRVHASIVIKPEGIYLKDQNSTNGTYINSSRINAYEEKLLNIGDIIKFANEEFFIG